MSERDQIEVRLVHPYQARKVYRCPGCGHAIPIGVGHYVVVPSRDPELRRHWHRPCWEREERSRGSESKRSRSPRKGSSNTTVREP